MNKTQATSASGRGHWCPVPGEPGLPGSLWGLDVGAGVAREEGMGAASCVPGCLWGPGEEPNSQFTEEAPDNKAAR